MTGARRPAKGVDRVREIALALPGVVEGTSYGTPGFRVKGKLFARMWQDGETLVARCERAERELLLDAAPEVFFLTDHYRDWPWVLVRIAKASRAVLEEALENSWRNAAPAKLVAEHDGEPEGAAPTRRASASRRPAGRAKRRSR